MFRKPLKQKSNHKCKSSERNQLIVASSQYFKIPDNSLDDVFVKKDVYKVKLSTSTLVSMTVFISNNQPMIIEYEKKLIPTVYLLNLLPMLLPTFTCHDQVVSILQNGADLMLPGLVLPRTQEGYGPQSYGNLEKGALCAINTVHNSTPFAVGFTNRSSFDMYMSGRRGVAVNVFHVFGDHLWQMGPNVPLQVRDNIILTVADQQPLETPTEKHPTGDLERTASLDSIDKQAMMNLKVGDNEAEHLEESVSSNLDEGSSSPDEQIMSMFLHAVKFSVRDSHLPLPINVFYAVHMLAYASPDWNFNVKRSKYKKVGNFLKEMENIGIIQLEYNDKNELTALKCIHREHEDYMSTRRMLQKQQAVESHESEAGPTQEKAIAVEESYPGPPDIQFVYFVNKQHRLLLECGFKNGDWLLPGSLRTAVTEYVKNHNLLPENKKGSVLLDDFLRELITLSPGVQHDCVTWRSLMESIMDRLPSGYRIVYPNGDEVFRKCQAKAKALPCVILESQSRGGGKKMITRIYNLDQFRIQELHFASLVQRGRACSCTPVEDKQGRSCLQCQGDQKDYITWLLEKLYGLKRENIMGYTEMRKKNH